MDAMVQVCELQAGVTTELNLNRSATFTMFGVLYLGVCQWAIYGNLFPFICRPLQSAVSKSLVQVVMDQLVVFPFVYFPLFYTLQAWNQPAMHLADGLHKWRVNLWSDCTTAWCVWSPVQLANFSIVPVPWRAPFISGTGMLWTIYLSHTKGLLN
eukprot:TRINITY_DN26484_c0_g1_i1.p2 TRINITY_DN26484_c0_g1~~TRINITY_DN26484_c0_g1_i1.p2  ORF type:complete len:155 (+),score=21.63 TRINITY_DN26484_c0_g1_i1:216-680(+)